MKTIALRLQSKVMLLLMIGVMSLGGLLAAPGMAAAACSALPTTNGTDSKVFTATTGTYRVWARIMLPTNTSNFYLRIDDSSNNNVVCNADMGNSSSITANTWTWVDYQGGNTATTVNASLTTGTNYTLSMTGDSGVEVDRVIMTGDTSCVPDNSVDDTISGIGYVGDNCASSDNTPPSVSITSPTAGASLSGTNTTVAANATDNAAVASVSFYLDGSSTAACTTTSPSSGTTFSCSITNPTTVGAHTLLAKATDTSGNVTSSSSVSVTVPDTTPPTVSVTAPAAGNPTVTGTIALTATAADNVGVTKVEFYVDGTLKATDTTSPYSASLDTTVLSNASHTVTAKAYDAAGNITTSTGVPMTVNNPVTPPTDTTPPTVSLTSPAAGAVTNTTTLNATATDNVGVTKVEFYVDGTLKNTDTTAPYSYALDTTALANGTHSLTAKAYDAAGNSTTSSAVSVTVSNFLPEDINQDGHVNLLDFSALAGKFGQSGSSATLGRADINQDGTVNLLDFSLLASKYGTE